MEERAWKETDKLYIRKRSRADGKNRLSYEGASAENKEKWVVIYRTVFVGFFFFLMEAIQVSLMSYLNLSKY